ncbi:hypothetical protein HMPREF0322_01218 [Desulfitobacterium hafniense DP7]|uniref:Uncharacterized protein n=1 Tax=Desulfitobacterium hafniense DP7 TaxID=537010 RepID=G9XJT7_DESHA|nr:hypothetical protein HMPREF0322_01218 [Desulfitobacterium hafniense DP7]
MPNKEEQTDSSKRLSVCSSLKLICSPVECFLKISNTYPYKV